MRMRRSFHADDNFAKVLIDGYRSACRWILKAWKTVGSLLPASGRRLVKCFSRFVYVRAKQESITFALANIFSPNTHISPWPT